MLKDQITIEYLFGLGLFSGCVGALETPSRYAFLAEMVANPREIHSVVALNSLLLNVARIIGSAIGGFVIAAIGEGMCFFLNTVSFIPIIGLLFAIHVQKTVVAENKKKYQIADIKEGFIYAYQFLPIKYMLALLMIISLCSVSYLILMPVFAVNTFNSGADTLGYLTSAIGIGAISGSIYLAKRSDASGLQHIIPIAAGLMGISLMLFSCIEKLIPGLIALFFAGMGMVLFTAATNTLIQTLVQDEKRGRIMSLYSMIMMGLTSVDYLGAGALAQYFGAAGVVFGGGIAAFAGAIFFAYKLSLMPKKSFGGV